MNFIFWVVVIAIFALSFTLTFIFSLKNAKNKGKTVKKDDDDNIIIK